MSGKKKDPVDGRGRYALLSLALVVLLGAGGTEAAVSCFEPVGCHCESVGCHCEPRKGTDGRGGWLLSCGEEFEIEYAIRNFVRLSCSQVSEQNSPYAPAMFRDYNLTDVSYFQFIMCPLPSNLTLAEVLEGVTVKRLKIDGDIPGGIRFDSGAFRGLEFIHSLILRRNRLESIPEDIFTNLTALRNVELIENFLQHLPELLFQGLENLTSIQLGSNRLEELHESTFSNLTKLKYLYLYKNQLKELPVGIFFGLKSLNVLDLANNQLEELSREIFVDMSELKHLSIRGNNFTLLQSDLFRDMVNLEDLNFSDNKLSAIPEDLLIGLTSLKKISLNNCNLKEIGGDFFSYATNVEEISMYNNRLILLPPSLFTRSINLQTLNLQYNDLRDLPSAVFDKNIDLKTLEMSSNDLTSLPNGLFDHLSNLQHLNLEGNLLTSLNGKLLTNNQNLSKLNLKKNHLSELEGTNLFGEGHKIITVDLSENRITTFPYINFGLYINLEKLLFNKNNLTYFTVPIRSSTVGTQIEVMSNQIRSVNLGGKYELANDSPKGITKVRLGGNPLNCDCKLFDFFSYTIQRNFRGNVDFTDFEELRCHDPPDLTETELAKVPPEAFVCQITEGCPSSCYCLDRAIDKSRVVSCSHLTDLPIGLPAGTTEVHLEENQIKNLDALGSSAWENVTKLFLDRNNIEAGEWPLPARLKVISMRGNQLDHLPRTLMDFVENGKDVQVYLGNNPWLCNCETLELKNWLYENKHANDLKVKDINEMYCSNAVIQNGSEVRTTVGRLTDEICPGENVVDNSQIIIVSVICAILACLLFAVSVLYYRNKQTVIAYFYINFHNVFVCFFNDEDLDEDKTFDAFVSYSSADRDVALDLVGHLENGDPSFKLCIHERDWLPGNLISWNIVNSVQNSRRTILVLSKDFLDSVWFQVEFHTAYYQMLEDRIDRLIVIVRGELPEKHSLDKDLQLLLTTKTFLEWGERWFWEKLRYALPHRRGTGKSLAGKNMLQQDKAFPLRQRPNPGLLKTVEEKIVSLSAETIFSKRTESPTRNGDVQVSATPANDPQVTSVPINSTKAQSRRFNGARTNSSENVLQNGSREVPPQVAPS